MKTEKEIRERIVEIKKYIVEDTKKNPLKAHTHQREQITVLRWVLNDDK